MRIAVFTKNWTNPAYEAARLGADRAAELLGAQTTHFVPATGDDPEEQSALVDQALAQVPDAIVFTPVHPTRVNAAIERINAAGIPLFAFINPIPAGRGVSYVGADDYRLTWDVAQYMFDHLRGNGSAIIVAGPAASVTSVARERAFRDAAAAHPGIVVRGTCRGDYLRERAHDALAQWLAANGCVAGCLAANDIMALGAIEALKAAGCRTAVAGINAIPEAIAAIQRGDMLATADFDAMHMAFLATECAIRHHRGEPVPAHINLPVQIVDRRNCDRWALPYAERALLSLAELPRSRTSPG